MTKITTSIEMLLKFRETGKQVVADAERDIDKLAMVQKKSNRAGAESIAVAKRQESALVGLRRRIVPLIAGFVSLAAARKAIGLSNVQERAELRLLGILKAQAGAGVDVTNEFEKIKKLASDLQSSTKLFGDEEFLKAAGDLLSVGGDLRKNLDTLPSRLKAAAGAGVVFFEGSLNNAILALSQTLGGAVGQLARRLPARNIELSKLNEEERKRALQAGLAFNFIGNLADSVLSSVSTAGFARQQAAVNKFGDAMEKFGDALKVIFVPAVALFASAAEKLASVLPTTGEIKPKGTLIGDFQRFVADDILTPFFAEIDGADANVEALRKIIENSDRQATSATNLRGLGAQSSTPTPAAESLLSDSERRKLIESIGLVSDFDKAIAGVRDRFDELAGASLSSILSDNFLPAGAAELGVLRDLAIAAAQATNEQKKLAAAEDEFKKSVVQTREASEAGLITEARRRELFSQALDELKSKSMDATEATTELRTTVADLLVTLQDLSDSDVTLLEPAALRALEDKLLSVDRAIATTKDNVSGLSNELGTRLTSNLADVIDGLATGTSSVEDFGLAFVATLRRILAEQAALKILQGLFGGVGGNVGGGGAAGGFFDRIGSFFGFASGGVVPGADLGRDSQIIAVRGGEYVVRPEAVRLPGVIAMLDAINDRRGLQYDIGLPDLGSPPSSRFGYASGGFVDSTASITVGAPSVQVLPVLTASEELAQELFSGRNLDLLAEAMRSRQMGFTASMAAPSSADGGLTQ